jgi:hypothetical protein
MPLAMCTQPPRVSQTTAAQPIIDCGADPQSSGVSREEAQLHCNEPISPSVPANTTVNEEVDVKELIENVTASSGYRYKAKDDRGNSLDTLKIIEDPQGAYLGIYHSQVNDTFVVKLAISSDLLSWHWVTDLDTEASQPTIQLLSDNGYLVAYEKSGPSNTWLRFRYYADRSDLSQARYQNEFDAPRTLAPTAEGTPNIYSAVLNPDALHSRIEVGFHYYRDQDVDRQARGTLTNFSSWTTQVETSLNTQLEAQNIAGNIGDRDFFQYQKRLYNLHEAQLTKNNASTWRIYLYDYSADMFTPLNINRTYAVARLCAPPACGKPRRTALGSVKNCWTAGRMMASLAPNRVAPVSNSCQISRK